MDWNSIVQQLGFPVAATFALSFVIYKIAEFFANKIYIPMQEKHMHLVDKLERALDDGRENNIRLVNLVEKISDKIDEHEDRITSIEQRVS